VAEGTPARFDSKTFAMPVVCKYDTEAGQFYRMWYYGRDPDFDKDVMGLPTGRIGLSESMDGISWTRYDGDQELGSVLSNNGEEWWYFDTSHVGVGDVQILSTNKIRGSEDTGSVYFMYTFGGDREEVDVSAEGEWDSLYNGWPQVVKADATDFRMYYHSYDRSTKKFTVGVALSTDGFEWVKKGPVLSGGTSKYDTYGVGCRSVLPDPSGKGYVMFGEGVGDDQKHTIGLYKSADGFEWTRAQEEPVLQQSEEGWDMRVVGCPRAVPMDDGSVRLYYCTPGDGMGMAVSDGTDWTKFTRVPTWHLNGP